MLSQRRGGRHYAHTFDGFFVIAGSCVFDNSPQLRHGIDRSADGDYALGHNVSEG